MLKREGIPKRFFLKPSKKKKGTKSAVDTEGADGKDQSPERVHFHHTDCPSTEKETSPRRWEEMDGAEHMINFQKIF